MTLRLSEEEYAALMERRDFNTIGTPTRLPDKPKRQKYGNRKVTVDGKRFDSVHEAEVYGALMLRVRAGELKCVARQVSFDLPIAVAPLPMAGATSPRESCGFQRGAAAASAARSSGGALAAYATSRTLSPSTRRIAPR